MYSLLFSKCYVIIFFFFKIKDRSAGPNFSSRDSCLLASIVSPDPSPELGVGQGGPF